MKIKRFLGIALALLMVLAIFPTAALAKNVIDTEAENAKLRLLDTVWTELKAVEAEAVASGADMTGVVFAVYSAALNNGLVDGCSFSEVTGKGFFFTVDGMACCYDYVARSAKNEETADSVKPIEVIPGTKNGPVNMNVLLVGPYYGHDSSFTNQYRQEAQSIANATGGTVTILQSTGATGPAIAAACPNNGIIIFDSHGTQSGTSSYLCLTTNAGITSQDYSNGWAVSAGSEAYIDGRYIENHIDSPLPNSIFWMAICEGMHVNGHGTTGYALLRAGAGCVYGYSQSVTFVGDYAIESIFWNKMKYENYTVAEAFAYMVATGCSNNGSEPNGNAFPIVMSPVDPFPTNPDSAQTVYCDWMLFGGNPIDAEGLTFAEDSFGVAPEFEVVLQPIVNPSDANNYSKTWTTSDPTVATVDGRGVVKGVNPGTCTITYTIASTVYSLSEYSYSASVEIVVSNDYLPADVVYVPAGSFIPGETYLIGYTASNKTYVMDNNYYDSNNHRNLKTVQVTVGPLAGVDCVLGDVDPGYEWTWGIDGRIYNADSNKYLGLSGNYLVLDDGEVIWTYNPVEGTTMGTITNSVNNKYLAGNGTNKYFSVFSTVHKLQLFRKLVRGQDNPPAHINGDANGDNEINSLDALIVLRYTLGLEQIDPALIPFVDMNHDGSVNSLDALEILRMSLGM